MRDFLKRIKGDKAQAMVEMALVLPILILLLVGICEFGRILGAYLLLNNMVRDGARYGVVGYSEQQIETLIRDKRAWMNDDSLQISITPTEADRQKGEELQVEVVYAIDLMTPLMGEILPDPLSISASCAMRIE